jgi:HK97 family phage major capsid protein
MLYIWFYLNSETYQMEVVLRKGWISPEFVMKTNTEKNMIISGYASVFEFTDIHNDVITQGAFKGAKASGVKLLWQHDAQKPIGIITSIIEDNYGLFIEAEINHKTIIGAEAIELIKQGAIAGLSVGFMIEDAVYNNDGIRVINSANLLEVSIVTFPANKKAEINAIKNTDQNIKITEVKNMQYAEKQEVNLVLKDQNYDLKTISQDIRVLENFIRKGEAGTLTTKSLTSAPESGGVAINNAMHEQIISAIRARSPMRSIASIENISTRALEVILEDRNFACGWVAEDAERKATDNAALIKKTIQTYEIFAQPKATQSLLNDAAINIESWLIDRLADQFTRLENEAFINGDGEGKPFGILKNTDVASIESSNITVESLLEMINSLDEAYMANASFLMNRTTLSAIQSLKDKNERFIWQPSLSDPLKQTIFGISVVLSANMPDIEAGKCPIALGDFKSAYKIVDRSDINIMRDPYTEKPFVKFYAVKRVGGDVINPEAMAFMKIAE